MKKITLLCLMLSLTVLSTAQSLVGAWQSTTESNDGSSTSSYVFNHRHEITYLMNFSFPSNGNTIYGTLTFSGTYTRAGQILNMKFDMKKATLTIDDVKGPNGRLSASEIQKIKTEIAVVMEQYRQMMASSMPESVTAKIKRITANELVFENNGKEEILKRVADK